MVTVGQQIGHYQICSVLGSGGMGEVFLANDLQLNRKVALKILSQNILADKDRLRRFEQEAKSASALNHPNILTIFEFGIENGTQFLATEYINGETLRERLQRNHLSLSETIDISIQIASALDSAHSANIIHRDIKPENIMVREDGYVKVLDFGLSKLVNNFPFDNDAQTFMQVQTLAGMIIGTVGYMSPEQARGKQVDNRTDIFSLGVVLYEMLARRQPFIGETVNHTIVAILEKEPPPLLQFIKDCPEEIDKITQKCLAKNPDYRYQKAKDLISDLRLLKQELDYPNKTKPKISVNNATETKTQILKAHTDKTLNIETDSVDKLITNKNLFVRLKNKAKQVINLPVSIFLIFVLTAISLFAFFAFARFRQVPPKPEAINLFNLGAQAIRDGTYYKASKLLEDAVKTDSNFAPAHARLAEAWMELDYVGRAQNELLKVRSLQQEQTKWFYFTDSNNSLYVDAITALILRDFQKAIQNYEAIVQKSPTDSYAFVDLGQAFEKNEEIEKAIENYEKAVAINPQNGSAFLRLGILLNRKTEFQKGFDAFDRAENIYDRQSNDEGVAEVRMQRGISLNIQEKTDAALLQLEKVINSSRASKHQQIRAMLQISSACCSAGKNACAEDYASKAIKLAKEERMENLATNGLIDLGNAFLIRGDNENAEQSFQQAIEFARQDGGNRNEARALLALGSLSLQQNNPEKAAEYVIHALPFYEKGGYKKQILQGNLILGRAYLMQKDYNAALKAFEKVEATEDLSSKAFVNITIGDFLMDQEKYPEALSRFRQSFDLYESLNSSTHTAYSLLNLSDVFCQIGRLEDAKESLSRAELIVNNKDNPQTQLSSTIQFLKAQIALSERNFTEVIKVTENFNPKTDFSLASEVHRIIGLAKTNLNPKNADGVNDCLRATQFATKTKDQRSINTTKLALAEAYLNTGNYSAALDSIFQIKDFFIIAEMNESAWRSWLIAARASKQKGDSEHAKEYASEALNSLFKLQTAWGEEHFRVYLTRPDINLYFSQAQDLTRFY
jgi:serine/threonine protein kinase